MHIPNASSTAAIISLHHSTIPLILCPARYQGGLGCHTSMQVHKIVWNNFRIVMFARKPLYTKTIIKNLPSEKLTQLFHHQKLSRKTLSESLAHQPLLQIYPSKELFQTCYSGFPKVTQM